MGRLVVLLELGRGHYAYRSRIQNSWVIGVESFIASFIQWITPTFKWCFSNFAQSVILACQQWTKREFVVNFCSWMWMVISCVPSYLPKKLSSGSLIINLSLAQRHDIIFHQPKVFRHCGIVDVPYLYMNVQRTRPLLFVFLARDLLAVRGKNKKALSYSISSHHLSNENTQCMRSIYIDLPPKLPSFVVK